MTITLTREEAQQVLVVLEYPAAFKPTTHAQTAALLRARLAQPEPEPELGVKFEQVANGIEVGYDFFGGVDIRLGGEFVYVHINYDPRYTDNAARTKLADKIVGLLTGNTAPPQRVYCSCGDGIVPDDGALCGTCVSLKEMREWQGLTDEERYLGDARSEQEIEYAKTIEAKLRSKNES